MSRGRVRGEQVAKSGPSDSDEKRLKEYIREKINQLLVVMGTKPLNTELLDDNTLIELDPIGIVACSFEQVLAHLRDTNKKLKMARDQLQAVFDTVGVCISIVNPDLQIINCNEKQKELLVTDKKEDPTGRYCYEVYCGNDSPALACPVIETLETGRPVFIREIQKKKKYFQIVTSPLHDSEGRISAVIEVSVDVTEKKKAEEARRQAEKLTSLGLFGAGLAHEINNPLGNILGYAKVLMGDNNLTRKQREKLEIIAEQAKKGSSIIKGLLEFSRQSQPSFQSVSINTVIEEAVSHLSRRIRGQKVKLETNLGEVPMVMADPIQIGQVIENLVINAIDALEDRTEPAIRIESCVTDQSVEVRVQDNGPGIPEAVQPNVFDPFFTTKPVGKGVGLGLSICAGIVEAHDGSVSMESEQGRGTTISFRIPTLRD
jgi:two-component system NtrC family sensor kinase